MVKRVYKQFSFRKWKLSFWNRRSILKRNNKFYDSQNPHTFIYSILLQGIVKVVLGYAFSDVSI